MYTQVYLNHHIIHYILVQINTLCLIQFRAEPAEGLKIFGGNQQYFFLLNRVNYFFRQNGWQAAGTLCRTEVLHGHLLGIKFGVYFYQVLIVFEVPSKGCLKKQLKIPNIDQQLLILSFFLRIMIIICEYRLSWGQQGDEKTIKIR